jgi:uncharacterized repeat protein (TIGR03803 family)
MASRALGFQQYREKIMKSIAVLCVLLFSMFAAAGKTVLLYSFQGGSDGEQPNTGLLMDQTGNLYGTTSSTTFEVSPDGHGGWTETILAEGNQLGVAPLLDTKGNLFGVAGSSIVFELSPGQNGWTYTVLHVFDGSEGNVSGLGIDAAENIYGTTFKGGAFGGGQVFRLRSENGKWTLKTLHSFGINDAGGSYPQGALVLAQNGTLYGATPWGGGHGEGVFYSLASGNWKEKVLFSFRGQGGAGGPLYGLSADQQGNLYCVYGGHSGAFAQNIIQFSRNSEGKWARKVIYTFPRFSDRGWAPTGTLIFDQDGNAYGTTIFSHGRRPGMVYELTPQAVGRWTETIVHDFKKSYRPFGRVARDSTGNIFGASQYGGTYGFGAVFKITP